MKKEEGEKEERIILRGEDEGSGLMKTGKTVVLEKRVVDLEKERNKKQRGQKYLKGKRKDRGDQSELGQGGHSCAILQNRERESEENPFLYYEGAQ